jgi:hypothetical protein
MENSAMDQKTFLRLAGAIFALVSLAHFLRIAMGWPIIIGDWPAPMWLSWFAFVIAGGLSYFGFKLAIRG